MVATPGAAPETPRPRIDRSRYRRVRRFFAGVLVRAVWWDVIMAAPLLRRLRTPALPRWCRTARRYRELAVELGGVLIKLGQFLSARVDVLPLEITRELAGLQDEVPPEALDQVVTQVEEDFGRPLSELFTEFWPEPVGAASLAQVHRARLPSGDEVVVKVLRPGIHRLVETDLAVLSRVFRWVRMWRTVRRRVDLGWLEREFREVTERELDLVTEGKNVERFAHDFADDDGVLVPAVHWSHTAVRTLTLENVGYIKVSDLEAIDESGVDRREVARRLYGIYMRQFFITHFVHADPHPGNIFVRPLPWPGGGDGEGGDGGRPFQLAFVDFGMTTVIPERLRQAMREFAIGLATRDARRMVHSYLAAGSLLPGADLERLVEAHEAILQRFWGVKLSEMREVAVSEARDLFLDYRDLLFEAPIQVQADMLFAMRAVGILAGLTTTLDRAFDPWAETVPFAERFALEEEHHGLGNWLEEIGKVASSLLRAPRQLDQILAHAERGTLGVRASLSPEGRERLEHLERSVDRLSWMVAAAACLVSGVVLRAAGQGEGLAPWLLGGSAVAGLIGLLRRHRP